MESQARSEAEARRKTEEIWEQIRRPIGTWIIRTIQTMGLPVPDDGAATAEVGRVVGARAVRRSMLRDDELHDQVAVDVYLAVRDAVAADRVPATGQEAYFFTITRRATWRRATARARDLFAHVEPSSGAASYERLATSASGPLENYLRHEQLVALARAVRGLSQPDRELLASWCDETPHEESAARLGVSGLAIRQRVHRILTKLRAELAPLASTDEAPPVAKTQRH